MRQICGFRIDTGKIGFAAVIGLMFYLSNMCALAKDVSLTSSGRYYQDAHGKPLFLIGYYGWAAVPDGYFIDHPSRYRLMMTLEQPYQLNYIRISLGVNRMSSATNPPSWNSLPTPVPFLYVRTGKSWKADLNRWDPVFWRGLRSQCDLAKKLGFIVNVSIFDGVDLRSQGGASYGYNNSFWNPANQTKSFYSDGDYSDLPDGFYRLTDFQNNTGIGFYQRRLIDKVCEELAGYDNVIFELGNELLSSNSAWNTAVIRYIRTRTKKPVTQENNGGSSNRATCCLQGWSQHNADTAAQLKINVSAIVGHGYPAWEDPDGPALYHASPDELRHAAWYSFVGGAAGFGGFTADFWIGGPGFQIKTALYYKYLETFIHDIGVGFTSMTPHPQRVSNSASNSCMAQTNVGCIAYILMDSSASVDLSGFTGDFFCRLYDPKTGRWSPQQPAAGGGVHYFHKPPKAADWVIYIFRKSHEQRKL
jgi:hypothetical protein